MQAADKTIRIDHATERAIADLAHFLGRSKKSVVRDAVHAFLDSNRGALTGGVRRATARIDASHATAAINSERAAFATLAFEDRLALQRQAIIEEFGLFRAEHVRVLDADFDGHPWRALLVETDIADGMKVLVELEMIASRLLCEPVRVLSTTTILRSEHERLSHLLAAATPI